MSGCTEGADGVWGTLTAGGLAGGPGAVGATLDGPGRLWGGGGLHADTSPSVVRLMGPWGSWPAAVSGDFWPLSEFGWCLSMPESRSLPLTHHSVSFSDSAKREVVAKAVKAPQEAAEVVKAPKVVDEAVKTPKVRAAPGSVRGVLWESSVFGPCPGPWPRCLWRLRVAGFPPPGVRVACGYRSYTTCGPGHAPRHCVRGGQRVRVPQVPARGRVWA